MKNLYKKLSVVILSGVLFIGGYLSNGLIGYANSSSNGFLESEDKVNRRDIQVGEYMYGYKIIGSNLHQKDRFSDFEDGLYAKVLEFDASVLFLHHIFKQGLQQGLYLVKIGNYACLIRAYDNIEKGISPGDYSKVPGGYYDYQLEDL